jgi:hypothetical protein
MSSRYSCGVDRVSSPRPSWWSRSPKSTRVSRFRPRQMCPLSSRRPIR